MRKQFSVQIFLDSEDIAEAVRGMDHDEAVDFILNIDLSFADAGFTELLIKRLAKSLRGDLDAEAYGVLITELSRFSP